MDKLFWIGFWILILAVVLIPIFNSRWITGAIGVFGFLILVYGAGKDEKANNEEVQERE